MTVRHARETEKEMKKRLDVQKDEYEETIKRHLSFIDQVCALICAPVCALIIHSKNELAKWTIGNKLTKVQ